MTGYWNEARILEPAGFQTVKELPNIPGSVVDFLAGRTYPLEGSAMPLPLHAPYTDPLEVLICGGSTAGAGQALDSCVSIQPEADEPTWVLERMVNIFITRNVSFTKSPFVAFTACSYVHGCTSRRHLYDSQWRPPWSCWIWPSGRSQPHRRFV